MARPVLANPEARRLFLLGHALAEQPTGPARGEALLGLIARLGFVQVDSIATVERAHHMILFARRQSYRPENLARLLERDRSLFEHWTHDASIIPAAHFPHWRLRFERDAVRLQANWRTWFREGYEEKFDEILRRIAEHGPVRSADIGEGEVRGRGGWWDWHPSKTALEWLWRTGALAVARREGFQKVYDLTERVIPAPHHDRRHPTEETIDWACGGAMDRLGFATSGEIAAFWNAVTLEEARDWIQEGLRIGALIEIGVEGADGAVRRNVARPGVLDMARAAPEAPDRVRILSPFDPALRDRNRTERLFGFHYRIEVFVPEAKRKYGYYVFPVLEGSRIIGRIDMKAFRGEGALRVRAFWPEKGIRLTKGRLEKLMIALDRMARFSGCEVVVLDEGWVRQTLGGIP